MIKKCLVGAYLIVVVFASAARSEMLLDRVMAIVNKEVITWSDLYREMEFNASDEIRAMKDADRQRFFKDNEMSFLESIIDMKLQLQEAAKNGITVSDTEVTAAINNIKSKYSMTDEAFNETIKKEGFTPESYKKKMTEQITLGRLIEQEVRSKVIVTEQEIDAYIAANKDAAKDIEGFDISRIWLKKTGNDQELEQKAQDIYKRIKAGESFSELARSYSDDSSAKTGGNVGFVRKCDMSEDFLNVCSGIKQGDISEPFRKNDGMYILRLNEARIFKSDKEVREALRQKLLNEKYNAELKSWARGLRDRAYVEIKT
ncbi:MAG: peptidylprolyl isomerase [Nitrospirae bacterium]|nr:peptidylprolyl isomerase [Nitrospirota bacterium]